MLTHQKLKTYLGYVLNRPFFYVTNRNRNRIRAVLEQALKETSILNPSDFALTLLYITGFLILQVLSINLESTEIWF